MSRKNIAILAVIFMVLGAYVYFFEIEKNMEEKKPAPFTPEKLINFDPNDVQEIVLDKKNGRIVFKKEGSQWKILEPSPTIARNERVNDFLLAVFDYGIVREITSDPTPMELSQYGLAPPEIAVKIEFKGDTPPQTLLIGADSPSGSCSYGMLKGQSKVLLLGIRYKMDLSRDVKFYID